MSGSPPDLRIKATRLPSTADRGVPARPGLFLSRCVDRPIRIRDTLPAFDVRWWSAAAVLAADEQGTRCESGTAPPL